MKKIVSLLLALLMLASVATFAGCTEPGFDYRTEDLTPYIYKLFDHNTEKLHITIADLADEITDADVKEEINKLLADKLAYYKKIEDTSRVVAFGDTVGIYYKGVLFSDLKAAGKITTDKAVKDMTPEELAAVKADIAKLTADDIKALTAFNGGSNLTDKTPYDIQLGSGAFIPGFEDGMADASLPIGTENYPLLVTFPKDYSANPALQEKDVVFFTNIKHVYERVPSHETLAWDDVIALQYKIELDEEDEEIVKAFGEETDGVVKETLTLDQDVLFHAAVLSHFNELAEGARYGTEMVFDYVKSISYTDKESGEKVETEVTAKATVTVFSLATVRFFTTDEIDNSELSFEDFCTKLGLKKEDYKDGYTTYFADAKTAMQKDRTAQIKANKYQAVIDALVEKSEIISSSDTIKNLKKAYKDEVLENIEYLTMTAEATGMASIYAYYASMNSALTTGTAREYIMYTAYGYTEETIDTQLDTDADAYIKEHIVFWQFVKNAKIEDLLTDAKYQEMLDEYEAYYDVEDLFEGTELDEAALREAFIWDLAAQYLLENCTTIETRPVKK